MSVYVLLDLLSEVEKNEIQFKDVKHLIAFSQQL